VGWGIVAIGDPDTETSQVSGDPESTNQGRCREIDCYLLRERERPLRYGTVLYRYQTKLAPKRTALTRFLKEHDVKLACYKLV
jgi:hypothetical protein